MEKYNIFQKLIVWVVDCWRLVMDARFNPLKYIPDPSLQAYFTLVLFVMWSCYFGLVATVYMGFNYDVITSIVIHMFVVIPLIFTNLLFKEAEKNGKNWISNYRTDQERKRWWDKVRRPNYEKRIKWDIDKEA
jgi:Trk-type K+ transport system membrane component